MSNSRSFRRATAALAATAAGALVLVPTATAAPAPETATGPSTTTAPYIVPVAPGVTVTSLLTVGDSVSGYRMVGIPDGLGATAGANGTLEVLMNHEIGTTRVVPPAVPEVLGIPRAHGKPGAFVSRWTVDPKSGAVTAGSDLIQNVYDWTYNTSGEGAYDTANLKDTTFLRFCSASLTESRQLLGTKGKGYDGQVFFANEENGNAGRTFGVTLDGNAVQLPRMGLGSIENTLVAPTKGDRTVVISNEDGGPDASLLRVYVGTKTSSVGAVDKAGLTNGDLFVLSVADVSSDSTFRAKYGKGVEAPATFAGVNWNRSAADQRTDATAAGAIGLTRIEDGSFDPRKPNDFYFLTTEGGSKTENPTEPGVARDGGGLWRLRFADLNDPSKGATLTLLLDGTEEPYLSKPDNMTIDNGGNILIQEDPGTNAHLARVLAYRIADGRLATVAAFDSTLFTTGQPGFITTDEESSGIIDVSGLVKKPNTFMLDAQVHASAGDAELVEKGQLLTLTIQSWGQVYGG